MTKMKTELYIYFFIYVLKLIILEIMNGLVQLFPFYFQEYNFFKLINKIIFKSLILWLEKIVYILYKFPKIWIAYKNKYKIFEFC